MKQEIKVYGKTGEFIREYNIEDHGENFMDLAKGFAKKIGGSLDKPMDANSILERTLTDEEKEKLAEIIKPKKRFCEFCDSKGVRHKKSCTKPK